MADALDRAGATLDQVIVTHAHYDHITGAPAMLTSAYPRARFRKIPWPGEDQRHSAPGEPLADGDAILGGGETLAVLHTPSTRRITPRSGARGKPDAPGPAILLWRGPPTS